MKEENYEKFIKEDIIGATLTFREMSVPNQMKAMLYLVDEVELKGNVRAIMIDNFKEHLKFIRQANNNWQVHIDRHKKESGVDSEKARRLANIDLCNDATEMYYQKYPDTKPPEVGETEESIEEEETKVNNFYRLLI